jgi:cytochrome c
VVIRGSIWPTQKQQHQMKRTLFILSCISLALASCGGNDTSKTNEENSAATTPSTTATAPTTATGPALPGEKLIAKADCIGCHNKTQKVIGPSYVDIAAKYPSNDANIALLADKIIKGGKGVWGEIPMTPHASMSQDDAKEMAKYILSLKN